MPPYTDERPENHPTPSSIVWTVLYLFTLAIVFTVTPILRIVLPGGRIAWPTFSTSR